MHCTGLMFLCTHTFDSLCAITVANNFDPDQAWQNVRPDLDTQIVFLKDFFQEVDFEKNQQTTKKREKILRGHQLMQNFSKPILSKMNK